MKNTTNEKLEKQNAQLKSGSGKPIDNKDLDEDEFQEAEENEAPGESKSKVDVTTVRERIVQYRTLIRLQTKSMEMMDDGMR